MNAADEAVKAAWCQLNHGTGPTPEWHAAHRAKSDLIGRTWQAGKDALNRDEKRLLRKYEATLDAAREATLAAYRACEKCNGSEARPHSQGARS